MKVNIGKEEWYPVYMLNVFDYGFPCEVPDSTVAKWKEVTEAFDKIQAEMRTYYNDAKASHYDLPS